MVGWSHRYIPSSDMFFSGHRKTVPNQLKIGDDRDTTYTFFFTEVIFFHFEYFRYFGALPRADLAQAGSQNSGRGGKKAENPGKRLRVPRGDGVAR